MTDRDSEFPGDPHPQRQDATVRPDILTMTLRVLDPFVRQLPDSLIERAKSLDPRPIEAAAQKILQERIGGAAGVIQRADTALRRSAQQRRGRRRLEESPSSQWRAFADQAIEMLHDDPTLTVREAAIRLFVNYEDLGYDSIAQRRAEDSAERKLYRYLDRRKQETAAE